MNKIAQYNPLTMPVELLQKIKNEEVVLIDVRTPQEFIHGHLQGAKNIPYEYAELFLKQFKEIKKPIVFVSCNGYRSLKMARYLRAHNVEAYDGGNWEELKKLSLS